MLICPSVFYYQFIHFYTWSLVCFILFCLFRKGPCAYTQPGVLLISSQYPMTALLAVLNLPYAFCPELGLPRFSLPPLQLLLMDILTAYQRPSRLETPLQALMPTPVQLSTVGQPLLQGNHKLHVIEVPFRLGLGCISHPYIQWCILIICSCIYMFIYRGYIHAT